MVHYDADVYRTQTIRPLQAACAMRQFDVVIVEWNKYIAEIHIFLKHQEMSCYHLMNLKTFNVLLFRQIYETLQHTQTEIVGRR